MGFKIEGAQNQNPTIRARIRVRSKCRNIIREAHAFREKAGRVRLTRFRVSAIVRFAFVVIVIALVRCVRFVP